MFLKYIGIVFPLILFHVSHAERRITDGRILTSDKSYVVYLLKANLSSERFENWLCGGALVTTEFILTSAACIRDVHYLYAIAGYNKYVSETNMYHDDCTRQMKKRIVFTCVSQSYTFDHRKLEAWSYIDIALAKVDTPYDLKDATYQIICSYIPTIIPINFDPKHQGAGRDVMVLGWGHSEFWRKHGDKKSQNNEELHYAPTMIMDKEECKEEYKIYPKMVEIIDKHMICSTGTGNLDDKGRIIVTSKPNITGCATRTQKLRGATGVSCEEELSPNIRRMGSRKPENMMEYTGDTRRSGICQNDHGGPLVTWVGTREVLIGVASVFKITEDRRCIGPYLYTSTQCNGAFIDCVLNHKFNNKGHKRTNESIARAKLCNSPPSLRGFDIIENKISWKVPVQRKGRGRKGRHDQKQQESNDRFSKYNYEGLPRGPLFSERVNARLRHQKHGNHTHHHRHRSTLPVHELIFPNPVQRNRGTRGQY